MNRRLSRVVAAAVPRRLSIAARRSIGQSLWSIPPALRTCGAKLGRSVTISLTLSIPSDASAWRQGSESAELDERSGMLLSLARELATEQGPQVRFRNPG